MRYGELLLLIIPSLEEKSMPTLSSEQLHLRRDSIWGIFVYYTRLHDRLSRCGTKLLMTHFKKFHGGGGGSGAIVLWPQMLPRLLFS